MSQATAYLEGDEVMEDVIWLEPGEEGFLLTGLFEELTEVRHNWRASTCSSTASR